VTGTFSAPTASVLYILEFFVSPAGDAEGKVYVGELTVTPTSTGTQFVHFQGFDLGSHLDDVDYGDADRCQRRYVGLLQRRHQLSRLSAEK
jgi:hypothetical protein